MEKRALIALALSFLIFMAFMYVGEKQKPQVPATSPAKVAKSEAPPAPPPEAKPAPAPLTPPASAMARPAKDVVVETPLFRAVFTEQGARLKNFQLKKYHQEIKFPSIYNFSLGPVGLEVDRYQDPGKNGLKPKELVQPGKHQDLPLSLSWAGKDVTVPALLPYEASQGAVTLKAGDTATLKFTGVSPQGVNLTKIFTFKSDSYAFDLTVKVANHAGRALDGHLDLSLAENFSGEASSSHFLGFNGSVNNRLEEIKSGGLKELKTFTGKIDFATLDEGYFITAMVPQGTAKSFLTLNETLPGSMVATLRTPVEALSPGQETQLAYTLYFGPKDLDDLKALQVGLERTVSFGWFDILGKPLLATLKFFNRYVHNYGIAIIILTIIIRVLFFYPSHKSYISMKEMQKLQPKVAKIREKHKDNKEAMNKEIMGLYRTFKVNPLGGCLPMVMQLPVFVALYNVLGYAIELRHAPFIITLPFTNIVWLMDLSAKDPLLITPIIMGATMVLQQRMTPSPGDPTQAKMMMFLPVVFTFMFLNFASGLVLYWMVNNVLSIVQQHYTNKYIT